MKEQLISGKLYKVKTMGSVKDLSKSICVLLFAYDPETNEYIPGKRIADVYGGGILMFLEYKTLKNVPYETKSVSSSPLFLAPNGSIGVWMSSFVRLEDYLQGPM